MRIVFGVFRWFCLTVILILAIDQALIWWENDHYTQIQLLKATYKHDIWMVGMIILIMITFYAENKMNRSYGN